VTSAMSTFAEPRRCEPTFSNSGRCVPAGAYPFPVTPDAAPSPTFRGVVAIDGPSGTGKSTVARHLAKRLKVAYLDTGAMYRAAALAVLQAEVDPSDAVAVAVVVSRAQITVGTDPRRQRTLLNGVDVTREIRSPATTTAVSPVSAVPEVRHQLVAQQRALIGAGPMVVEGRDIGSVVWPDAELKIYLTASEQVRARRRAGQHSAVDVAEVADAIRRRDAYDSERSMSPLRRADGAVEIDTTEMSVDDVVRLLVERALGASVRA